jgi:hypothetical protein
MRMNFLSPFYETEYDDQNLEDIYAEVTYGTCNYYKIPVD